MNCEKCENLLSEFIDGSLNRADYTLLKEHLDRCPDCAELQRDLKAIVGFCREHRGEYHAPPNPRALWLRISNSIESERKAPARTKVAVASAGSRAGFMSRSWELSFRQLAVSVAAIVVAVSLVTTIGLKRLQSGGGNDSAAQSSGPPVAKNNLSMPDRILRQQQIIDYWNQRVELNKARWSPEMRATFDRNMSVIDAAVSDSMRELNTNPHDEVSEEILNAALNDKVELLKEFAEL